MILRRTADEVHTQIDELMLATLDGTELLGNFELDHARSIELSDLNRAVEPYVGRPLEPANDAAMALALREALPLTRREAADRTVWWWLSLRRYPTVVRNRWAAPSKDGTITISRERVLGQINRNALARLWWGAEMARSTTEPSLLAAMMFRNQDLFEALIGRSLGRNPKALEAILRELSSLPGKEAREIVRDFQFLLSTLVLEAMSPDEVTSELRALRNARVVQPA